MANKILDKSGNPVLWNGKDEAFASYFTPGIKIVKSVDMKARKLTIVGTDETKDRDGDIIMMKGWDIKDFLNNPVFLWAHNYSSVPLAAASKVIKMRNPTRMKFVEVFPTEGLYPFADQILALYNEDIINASSVGFIPKKSEPLEKDEGDEDMYVGRRFLKQILLELSGCAVPCNPNALQEAMKSFDQDFEKLITMQNVEIPEPSHKDDILEELEKVKKGIEFIDENKKTQIVVNGLKDEDVEEVFETVKADRPPVKRREPKEDATMEHTTLTEEFVTDPDAKFEEVKTELEQYKEILEDYKKLLDSYVSFVNELEITPVPLEENSTEGTQGVKNKYDEILTPPSQTDNGQAKSSTGYDMEAIKELTKELKRLIELMPKE